MYICSFNNKFKLIQINTHFIGLKYWTRTLAEPDIEQSNIKWLPIYIFSSSLMYAYNVFFPRSLCK